MQSAAAHLFSPISTALFHQHAHARKSKAVSWPICAVKNLFREDEAGRLSFPIILRASIKSTRRPYIESTRGGPGKLGPGVRMVGHHEPSTRGETAPSPCTCINSNSMSGSYVASSTETSAEWMTMPLSGTADVSGVRASV